MIEAMPGWTVIKYIPPSSYEGKDGIYVPSGDEMDRWFKKKSTREVSAKNPPKNMYRWGKVESSHYLDKGAKVYYSQYDSVEVKQGRETFNVVRDEHIHAREKE